MCELISQITDLDSRFGVQRSACGVSNTLYMRRRGQLLEEALGKNPAAFPARTAYLPLRRFLLVQRYGLPGVRKYENVQLSWDESPRTPDTPGPDERQQQVSIRSALLTDARGLAEGDGSTESLGVTQRESPTNPYSFGVVHGIFNHHKAAVTTVQFAQGNNEMLAFASLDGTITIAQVGDHPRIIHLLNGHKAGITGRAYPTPRSCSGLTIPTILGYSPLEYSICAFYLNIGHTIRSVLLPLGLFIQPISCVSDSWHSIANDLFHISINRTNQIEYWSRKDFRSVLSHWGGAGLAWAVTGSMVVSVSLDRTFRLWHTETGQVMKVVDTAMDLLACTLCPTNNNMLLIGTGKGLLYTYNISLGKKTTQGKGQASGPVKSIVFNTDGTIVWTGDGRGVVHSFKFDATKGRLTGLVRVIISEGHAVTSLTYSPGRKTPLLLLSCRNNTLYVLSVENSQGLVRQRRAFPLKHSSLDIKSIFGPHGPHAGPACV
eukprot:Ihof_evm2s918 gene=Ihof_evmTU2s918